jgi:glucose-1-phosphate adenylyltransferase
MDIGTPEKYLQANLDALAGRFATEGLAMAGDSVVAGDATVSEASRVSCSCLGAGVVVEPGARVTESVLLPGVTVGRDAVVHRSVLGEGVKVSPGASVDGAAVRDHETIAGRQSGRHGGA